MVATCARCFQYTLTGRGHIVHADLYAGELILDTPSDSFVDRAYERLKRMAVGYHLKPGQRLNEIELAKQLGVSRTPLREALNRLNIEGFTRFSPGEGFYSRNLSQREILDLYELRKAIELHGVRLAIQHANEDEILALRTFLDETGP